MEQSTNDAALRDAQIKLRGRVCSSDGCTKKGVKGGWPGRVPMHRHGANRNSNDESTAFASCIGSEYEKTTVRILIIVTQVLLRAGSLPAED
jgi:hypothetical protein